MVATPNLANSLLAIRSDTTRAAPLATPKNRPRNPASSSASGYRAVAARANGNAVAKYSRPNRPNATAIHRSSLEARTDRVPSAMARTAPPAPRRRPGARSLAPDRAAIARASTNPRTSRAAHTTMRFSTPSSSARGRVRNPPITPPAMSAAPYRGKSRLA
jgi:hypothetical protein